MNKPSLLILAAGLGSRYGSFKQIDPVGPHGEILIDYSIYDALRAGFGKIVVLTQPMLEQPMREHFTQVLGADFDLVFAFQDVNDLPDGFTLPEGRQKPWGTGHAIWAARSVLDEPFGVINADDFYGPESYQILYNFLANRPDGEFCMVGFELARTLSDHGTVSRGICHENTEGYLIDVIENTKIAPDPTHGARTMSADGQWHPLPGDSIASMNLWGLDPSIMAHLERLFREFLATEREKPKSEFFIPTVLDTLIKQNVVRCKVLKSREQWFGMTYKEDRQATAIAIQELIRRGIYPHNLRTVPSVTVSLPNR